MKRAGLGFRHMFSYEIRTFGNRWRSSLIMFAQCPNDLAAIMVARDATRRGQAVEVWREERLVYRVGFKSEHKEPGTFAKSAGPGNVVARASGRRFSQ